MLGATVNKLTRKIWFPTEQDLRVSRLLYPALLPIILILDVSTSLPAITMVVAILAFTLQAVILIRASYTLPIGKDFESKYAKIISSKNKFSKYISTLLPIISLGSIFLVPSHFIIVFITAIFISITAMLYSGFNTLLFLAISLFYLIAALVICDLQGSFGGTIIVLIFSFLLFPYFISFVVKIRRIKNKKSASNNSLKLTAEA